MNLRTTLLTGLLALSFARVAAADEEPADLSWKIHGADPVEVASSPVEPVPPLAPRVAAVPVDETRMRNPALFYAGVGTGLAGVVLFAAAAEIHPASTRCRPPSGFYLVDSCDWRKVDAGLDKTFKNVAMVFSGAIMTAGLSMAIVGGWEVPVVKYETRLGDAESALRLSVVAGASSGGVKLTF